MKQAARYFEIVDNAMGEAALLAYRVIQHMHEIKSDKDSGVSKILQRDTFNSLSGQPYGLLVYDLLCIESFGAFIELYFGKLNGTTALHILFQFEDENADMYHQMIVDKIEGSQLVKLPDDETTRVQFEKYSLSGKMLSECIARDIKHVANKITDFYNDYLDKLLVDNYR